MAEPSRLERVSEGLRVRMLDAMEGTFKHYTDDAGTPVGTVRKTPEEQLQDFMKLTPEHIAQYRTQYGDAAVENYFEAMKKLGVKQWPQ